MPVHRHFLGFFTYENKTGSRQKEEPTETIRFGSGSQAFGIVITKQSSNLQLHIRLLYLFLDIFYRLETNNKNLRIKEDSGYAAHSCEYFKSVITDGTYTKHRNYLKQIGILLIDWRYKENEAMGYKYNPTYESNLVTVMIQPDSPIWKNIIKNSNIFNLEGIYFPQGREKTF